MIRSIHVQFLSFITFLFLIAGCGSDDQPNEIISSDPGRHDFSVMADGVKRWFIYYIPQNYVSTQPVSLILAFHGGDASMENMWSTRSDLKQLSDQRGFILVFPNGQNENDNKGNSFWNGVHCCGSAFQSGISDVVFIDVLLDSLQNALSIDPLRIHAIGFSNGGHIVHLLAADRPDRFASVATMGSNVGASSPAFSLTYPDPKGPIPILLMHGMSDLNAPYNGGSATGLTSYDFTSFAEGLSFWANNSGCTMPADTTITIGNKGNIMTLTYAGCSKDVIGIALQNVQHGWLDLSFAGFDGTKAAIDFFDGHPK